MLNSKDRTENDADSSRAYKENQGTEKKKQPSVDWPSNGIRDPCEHDVLFGRGGATNHYAGNKVYRKLVLNKTTEYENGTRMGRGIIAMDIVRSWRAQDPPGRFLKKAIDDDLLWNDVGDDRAKEKTCQLFREHRRSKETKKVEPRKGFGVYTDLQVSNAKSRPVPGSHDSHWNLESSSQFMTIQTLLELSHEKITRLTEAFLTTSHHTTTTGYTTAQMTIGCTSACNNKEPMKEHANTHLSDKGRARHEAFIQSSHVNELLVLEETSDTQESRQSRMGCSNSTSTSTTVRHQIATTCSARRVQSSGAESSVPKKFSVLELYKSEASMYERSHDGKTELHPRLNHMGNNRSAISMTSHNKEEYSKNHVLPQEFHTQDMKQSNSSYQIMQTMKRGIDVLAESSLRPVKRASGLSAKAPCGCNEPIQEVVGCAPVLEKCKKSITRTDELNETSWISSMRSNKATIPKALETNTPRMLMTALPVNNDEVEKSPIIQLSSSNRRSDITDTENVFGNG